jgi:hypothetical protein
MFPEGSTRTLLISPSSHNKHKQQPRSSTTARVTQCKWPTPKSRASMLFCAKSTNYKWNLIRCVALAKSSRASSRGSIAWIAAYEPVLHQPDIYDYLHHSFHNIPPTIRYRNRHTLVLADTLVTSDGKPHGRKIVGKYGQIGSLTAVGVLICSVLAICGDTQVRVLFSLGIFFALFGSFCSSWACVTFLLPAPRSSNRARTPTR